MKQKSIGLNAVFNAINTASSVVFPLITYGHVARALGIENIGKYNFSYTYVTYFQLIASLGISTYAIREGARYRENRVNLNKFASQMLFINLCATLVAYVLLVAFSFVNMIRPYSKIIFIISFSIILTTLGCEWIFSIYEDYGYITIRSILFKIVALILVLLFVNSKDDLVLYTWIMLLSGYGSNIINLLRINKYIDIVRIKIDEIKIHLRPVFQIFVNSAAISIYVSSDTTILGFLANDYYVGLYSVSGKVYSIVKTMIAAVIIVSIPRLSLYANLEKEKFNQLANSIFNILLCIMLPAMTGLFVLSPNIILILGGDEFMNANTSLRILCVAMLVSVIGWFYSSAILIPTKKEKKVLTATVVAAIINVALNFILIPLYFDKAAAVTTLLAEFVSMLMCMYYSNNIVSIRVKKRDIIAMLIGCFGVMSICVIISKLFVGMIVVPIAGICSLLVYFLILKILKCSVFEKIKTVF
ncbi:flippase [Blautia obeum]|jgi:O-antigen/teichoic acid export membrane protein|uniref:flippase n=1 Tax=Blautia obeum TaxID=40520 RepID=UPI00156FCD70|nr:flippase [Blautia obeum]NSC70116.1 flippase [Blautia obeum]